MKKRIILAVLPVLLVTLLASGCGSILVTKDGETVTRELETRQYNFTEFTQVNIGSAFDYEIQQADTYSISITAGSNLFDDIRVTKVGQTLDIGMEFPGGWALFNFNPRLQAVITMPKLQGLDSSGATHGTVTGFRSNENLDVTASGASTVELAKIAADDVTFDVSGASKVTGDIEASNMGLKVSGASTVQLKGLADSLAIDGSGASNLKLADMKVANADVILSGASDATISLDGSLNADLSGASTLEYTGEPVLGTTNITGASTLKKK
jgi:hypothetical protein